MDFGSPFAGEIKGTEDDPIFQTERFFVPDAVRTPGYRIQLPSGRNRVTIHCAEIYFLNPGVRNFDILLEGRPVLLG